MMRTDLMSSIMDLWKFCVFSLCQLAALLSAQSGIFEFSSASLLTSDVSPLGSNSYSSSPSSPSSGSTSISPLAERKHSARLNPGKYDRIREQTQYPRSQLPRSKLVSCWEEVKLLSKMSSSKSSLEFSPERLLL